MTRFMLMLAAALVWSAGAGAHGIVFENPVALEGEEFETAVDYNGIGLAYVDWDGDGKPDIVAGNRIGHLSWYKNIGTKEAPAFGRGQVIKEGWKVYYEGFYSTCNVRFQVVDWNNDGTRDFVVGLNKLLYTHEKPTDEFHASRVAVWLGKKDGTFEPLVTLKAKDGTELAEGHDMPAPFAADVDGDGKKDLVVGWEKGGMSVFLNKGTDAEPVFEKPAIEIPVEGQRTVPVVVDWNGDGKLDLVVGMLDGMIRVYLREGDGKELKFGKGRPIEVAGQPFVVPPSTLGEGLKTSPAVPCVCDFNGDGKKDLLLGTQKQFTLLLNTGTDAAPAFAKAETLKGKGIASTEGSPANLPPMVYDVDGDGKADLLMTVDTESVCNALVWFRNVGEKGKPGFETGRLLHRMPVGTRCGRFNLADLNGDGLFDIVASAKGGGVPIYVAWNTGAKNAPKFPMYGPASTDAIKKGICPPGTEALRNAEGKVINDGPAGGYGRATGDLDGDGKDDIIEAGNSCEDPNAKYNYKFVFWYRNAGDGKKPVFAVPRENLKADGKTIEVSSPEPVLVDFNDDGVLDLLVSGIDCRTHVFINKAAKGQPPMFADAGVLTKVDGKPANIGEGYQNFAPAGVGDLDGDGVLDAVERRGNDGFDIWFFRGVKK